MAAWIPRIAIDEDGKYHFVQARYDPADMRQRCGIVDIPIVFKSLGHLKEFANDIIRACDQPVINLKPYEYEPEDEYEDDNDGDGW